ncbi:YuiB family protein, partial [Exiguobacterium sp.]
ADITMFAAGLAGIIIAGLSIRFLRKSGYQMF